MPTTVAAAASCVLVDVKRLGRPGVRTGRWIAEQQLAGASVVSLMHGGVLGHDVNVAHPPLQRRGFVQRISTAKPEAFIHDAHAGCRDPGCGLRSLREQGLVFQRPGECVAPMAFGLSIRIRTSRTEVGFDPAEIMLE